MNAGQFARILASGIAFASFGMFGILVNWLIVPFFHVIPMPGSRRRAIGRWIVAKSFAILIHFLCLMRLMRLTVRGLENYPLHRPVIVAPNHPTYIDVAILLSNLKNLVCIVKTGVWNNPCMGPLVRLAGFIPNIDAEHYLSLGAETISKGQSILLFPEGTRSFRDRMQTFQRGAAQLALRTSTPILPVVITITPPSLYKGCRWFQMAEKACDLIVDIQPPVEIESFLQQDANPALAARTLTSFLENYYSQRLQGYYKGIQ